MGVDRIAGGVTLPRPCSSVPRPVIASLPPAEPVTGRRKHGLAGPCPVTSSRGAARSLRRAATWRSQSHSFEQPDCHASLAMTAMGKLS